MTRPTVLVTGGNSGIGFECARALARDGWHVVVASRNREASADAVRRITGESGGDATSELGLDLGSLASVRECAREIAARDLPLRALVLNAGLQMTSLRRSADGFETTFAVNHLGHFLLANLLLSRLIAHAPARIVVVASGVHDPKLRTGMPKADVGDLRTLAATGGPRPDGFDGRLAYVNSKLCNLWFVYELARRLEAIGPGNGAPRVTVNGFDPGLVPGSGLARDYPPALRFVWDRILPGLARVLTPVVAGINPAPKAGRALARLVTDPALASTSARYFPSHTRWRDAPSSEASYDVERAQALWDESVRMSGLTPDESQVVRDPHGSPHPATLQGPTPGAAALLGSNPNTPASGVVETRYPRLSGIALNFCRRKPPLSMTRRSSAASRRRIGESGRSSPISHSTIRCSPPSDNVVLISLNRL